MTTAGAWKARFCAWPTVHSDFVRGAIYAQTPIDHLSHLFCFRLASHRRKLQSPEAIAAARSLVTTLGLSDQYKALLPVILLASSPC